MWALGTRPLLAASVGVYGLLALACRTSVVGLTPSLWKPATSLWISVAAGAAWGVGTLYGTATSVDRLSTWHERL